MSSLTDELTTLHDGFVEAINLAIAEDDLVRADRLAAAYDDEALQLIAEREGKPDLLPMRRTSYTDSGLRGLVRRFTMHRAA
jgi:hypothetical protein